MEYNPHYITFEEAIEFITVDYGAPEVIRDTVIYEDGTVRNRIVYWTIDPPEYYEDDSRGNPIYLITISMRIWNQPYGDQSTYYRYRLYGWEVTHWQKSSYVFFVD